jgi:hypothetical protein
MARTLFSRANEPKQLYLVPGAGHNDLWNSAGPALVDRIAAFITDNLTSEQILSEDYFRFADNPGVGPSMTTNAFIDTNHARLLAGRRKRPCSLSVPA